MEKANETKTSKLYMTIGIENRELFNRQWNYWIKSQTLLKHDKMSQKEFINMTDWNCRNYIWYFGSLSEIKRELESMFAGISPLKRHSLYIYRNPYLLLSREKIDNETCNLMIIRYLWGNVLRKWYSKITNWLTI